MLGYACYRNPLADSLILDSKNLVYVLAGYGFWGNATAAKAGINSLLASDQDAANACFVCAHDRIIRGNSYGCFPYDVKIAMDDGSSTKRVQDIRVGDFIWNPKLQKPVRVESVIEGAEQKDLVVVHAGSLELRMSTEHPVVTRAGMKQAIELVVGDVIQDADGESHAIDTITREALAPGKTVVNFELARSGDSNDGLLVADGVIVGDLITQRALAAERKKEK
jgi:hypothetical protein